MSHRTTLVSSLIMAAQTRMPGSFSTLTESACESESDIDDGITSVAYSLGYYHGPGPGTLRLRPTGFDNEDLHFGLGFRV
jgi:hypothetical protein